VARGNPSTIPSTFTSSLYIHIILICDIIILCDIIIICDYYRKPTILGMRRSCGVGRTLRWCTASPSLVAASGWRCRATSPRWAKWGPPAAAAVVLFARTDILPVSDTHAHNICTCARTHAHLHTLKQHTHTHTRTRIHTHAHDVQPAAPACLVHGHWLGKGRGVG